MKPIDRFISEDRVIFWMGKESVYISVKSVIEMTLFDYMECISVI